MRKSRLSQPVQNKLIELFVAGATARTAAELTGVNKNTAAYYFHRLRLLIFHRCEHLEMFDGEVEADESYFGGCRKGKRGRGAAGKVVVFGLLKRNGCRNRQRCLHFRLLLEDLVEHLSGIVKNVDRHGKSALFLIMADRCLQII